MGMKEGEVILRQALILWLRPFQGNGRLYTFRTPHRSEHEMTDYAFKQGKRIAHPVFPAVPVMMWWAFGLDP